MGWCEPCMGRCEKVSTLLLDLVKVSLLLDITEVLTLLVDIKLLHHQQDITCKSSQSCECRQDVTSKS